MDKTPRVLVISSSAWDDNNVFGNTFSNLFTGWDRNHIFNIFCDEGLPNTNVCKYYYQMSEKMIVKNMLNMSNPSGVPLVVENKTNASHHTLRRKELFIVNQIKRTRLQLFFWLRDLMWLFGNWKSSSLYNWIDNISPEIIFLPMYTSFFMNIVQMHIVKYCKKPYIYFTSDDGCSLKQFSLSPLFWIDRIIKRPLYKQNIAGSKFVYVISEKQKMEYEKIFGKECRLLFKGADFSTPPKLKKTEMPLNIVYTGNLGVGRWKSLVEIAKAIDFLNNECSGFNFFIYSITPLTGAMKKAFSKHNSIKYRGAIESSEVKCIQEKADVLVHVESFNIKDKLRVRLSFSTKLVDYFNSARCILAVGPSNIASIEYLMQNDAAIVISKREDIVEKLSYILKFPFVVQDYANKAWLIGKRNHQIQIIQERLRKELSDLT